MIAVWPLTTAGAPSDEAKEPAIAHIPKPTAPTPANSFNPLAIMACAPKNIGGGCMIDYRQLSEARPRDTRMLTPPPVLFVRTKVTFGLVAFNARCLVFNIRCAEFFVIIICQKNAPLRA